MMLMDDEAAFREALQRRRDSLIARRDALLARRLVLDRDVQALARDVVATADFAEAIGMDRPDADVAEREVWSPQKYHRVKRQRAEGAGES